MEKKKKRKTCFQLKLATVQFFIAITFGVCGHKFKCYEFIKIFSLL